VIFTALPLRRAAARDFFWNFGVRWLDTALDSEVPHTMPRAETELVVITKTYELCLWTSKHVANFPKSHKFTLGDRLLLRLYQFIELLIRAKFTRDRVPILQDGNLELELLRFQFRLAKDLKCLSLESYGYAARELNEIGKLVGGWIKASQAGGATKEGRR
jgi:hypothetical protein